MNGYDLGRNIADGIFAMIVAAFLAGGAVFALLFFGLPWLWRLMKPWLHTVTG